MDHATSGALAPAGEWRCARCSALLGRRCDAELHIRHKAFEIYATGRVRAMCRRCGTTNETVHVPATGDGASS